MNSWLEVETRLPREDRLTGLGMIAALEVVDAIENRVVVKEQIQVNIVPGLGHCL